METIIESDLAGLNKRLSQLSSTPAVTLNIPTVSVNSQVVHSDTGPRDAAQAGNGKPNIPVLNLPNGGNQKTLNKVKSDTALHGSERGSAQPHIKHSASATQLGAKAKAKGGMKPPGQKGAVRGSMRPPNSPTGSNAGDASPRGSPSRGKSMARNKSRIVPTSSGRPKKSMIGPDAGGGKRNQLTIGGMDSARKSAERQSALRKSGLKKQQEKKDSLWHSDVQTPESFLLKNLRDTKPLCYDPTFTSSVERVSDEVLSISKTLVQWQSEFQLNLPDRMNNGMKNATVRPHFTEILDGIFPERLAGRDWHVEVSDIKNKRIEVLKAERAWQRMQAQEEARSGKVFSRDLVQNLGSQPHGHGRHRDMSILSSLHDDDHPPTGSDSLLRVLGGPDEEVASQRSSMIPRQVLEGEINEELRDPSLAAQDVNARYGYAESEPEAPWSEHSFDVVSGGKGQVQSKGKSLVKPINGQGPFAQKGDGKGENEDKSSDAQQAQVDPEVERRDKAATKIQAEFRRGQASVTMKALRDERDALHRSRLAYRSSIFQKHPMIDSAVAFTLKPNGVVTRSKFGLVADKYTAPLRQKKQEDNKRQFRFGDWHKNSLDADLPDVSHLYPDGFAPRADRAVSSPQKGEGDATLMSTPQAKAKNENRFNTENSFSTQKSSEPEQALFQSQSSPAFFGDGDLMVQPMNSSGLKKKKKLVPQSSKKFGRMQDTSGSPFGGSPARFSYDMEGSVKVAASGKMDALAAWAHQQNQQAAQDTEDHHDDRPRMPPSDANAIGPSEQDDRELLSKAKLLRKRRWALVVKKNKAPVLSDSKAVGSRSPSPVRSPSPTKKTLFAFEVLSARMMVPDQVAGQLHYIMAVTGDEKLPLHQAKAKRDRCSNAGSTWGPDEENCYGVNFRTYVVRLENVEHAVVAIHNADIDVRKELGGTSTKFEPAAQLCATKEISLAEAVPGMNKAPLYQRGGIVGEIIYLVN
eukprot:gnl/MRDRNA2_/MRDRNA2_27057_c0_seq1.p1 gnl/MRDRNA2_/MRDRNA2_27057_c0~~gnl/MRDRNA2_/MRDRNA2_27057_c0_seq1.p1  ORF type:complete len:975 (+),score=191.55 gnl/MRDRNA2_/MRDRNA2_27057_c0_seq1:76-3000(+)